MEKLIHLVKCTYEKAKRNNFSNTLKAKLFAHKVSSALRLVPHVTRKQESDVRHENSKPIPRGLDCYLGWSRKQTQC